MQDPVADMLTRLRNAQAMGIQTVRLPYSNLKFEILKVLKQEGYIEEVLVIEDGNKKDLDVNLKYYQDRPVIEKIKRVSRPSLRIYKGYDELPLVRGGLGVAIISTPNGVMSDKTARANKIGGEVLCTVE
jgi:small subunit ribosomal protein S8